MGSIRRGFLTRPLFYIFIGAFAVTLLACRVISAGAELTAEKIRFQGSGEIHKASWNNKNCVVFQGRLGNEKVKVLINLQQVDEVYVKELLKNGFVYVDGEISEPERAGNFGEFDYADYMRSRGIDYIGNFCKENISAREQAQGEYHSLSFYAAGLRSDIFECLNKYLDENHSGWVMSVMTGDTGYLEREEKESLSFAGFSHLVAVSGAHITFFSFPFELLLKRFTQLGLPKKKLLLLIPMVFLWYAAGASPSVTRAVVMAAYSVAALCLRRHYDAANALGFSGLLQLIVNPYSVYNTGFLLSYGAVICIIFILPKVKKHVKTESKMIESLLTGISVNMGLMPLLLYLFNGFSIIGSVANVAVSYAANFLCVGGYIVYGAEKMGLPEKIIGLFGKGILGATEIFKGITEKIADSEGFLSRFEATSPSITFFIVYYLIIIVLITEGKARKAVAVALPAVLILGVCNLWCMRGEITVFDVGQGSAALIETCDGFCGLIDTGDGTVALEELLLKEGVEKLDFLVLSHGHDDHYGGIEGVLDNTEVKSVFVPSNKWDVYCNDLAENCVARGIETIMIENSQTYKIGRYSFLQFSESQKDEKNLNNGSLMVKFWGDWGSMLFPGDTENEVLERYVREGTVGQVDLLCFPHHGGSSSGSEKFLFSAAPEYVIISCGKDNQYGHPSESVLESIGKAGVPDGRVYRTDEGGAVKIRIGKIPFVAKEFVFVWQKKMTLSQVFQI